MFWNLIKGLGKSKKVAGVADDIVRDLPEALPALGEAVSKTGKLRGAWKSMPKWGRWLTGLGGVGALGGAAALFGGDEPYKTGVNQELLDALSGTTAAAKAQEVLERNRRQSLADIEQMYAQDNYANQARSALAGYINNLNAYAAAQGPAISKAYQGIAQQAQDDAAAAAAMGQEIAANVDRTYGDTASQAAALAAGQGTSAQGTSAGQLTGVSGEMAAMPDVTRAYGQSLADYLGRQGNISRQDLAAMAQSYLAQGVGTQAQLQAEAAGLGSRAQYNLANQIAQYEAERQAQRAAQEMAIKDEYRRAAMEQELGSAQRVQAGAIAAAMAPRYWKIIKEDSTSRRFWAENFGVTDADSLARLLTTNPELKDVIGQF